jgi:hypothetical protein
MSDILTRLQESRDSLYGYWSPALMRDACDEHRAGQGSG